MYKKFGIGLPKILEENKQQSSNLISIIQNNSKKKIILMKVRNVFKNMANFTTIEKSKSNEN